MVRVLIVEDDRSIVNGLEQNLRFEGYEVLVATDGEQGLAMAWEKTPDLVILDIMLPKRNGYEVCRALRGAGLEAPILMLTAKGEEADKVLGLGLGADDYLSKPFGIMELIARVKALLRRVGRGLDPGGRLYLGQVVIDFDQFTAMRSGEPLELTARQFELLRYLAKAPNRAHPRQTILNAVWGGDYYGTERTVDNFIVQLRQKIEANPKEPRFIQTVHGIGYRLVVEG